MADMNPAIDPRLIARLSTEFASLSEHLNLLGRDLETLHRQVLADTGTPHPAPVASTQATGAVVPAPTVPPAPAGSPGPIPPGAAWAPEPAQFAGTAAGQGIPAAHSGPIPPVPGWAVPAMGTPVAPGIPAFSGAPRPGWAAPGAQPWYQPMPPPQRRAVPARPIRPPWWQREGVISRALAIAGVAVTLIGVVMLLVLAAQAGFFGPVPRVAAGAVFSAALVATGTRVYAKAGGRVGGIALAATGIAGGYLDVVAVTTMYGWLNPVVGYVVAFGIAAGGVALAVQWRSQGLAVLVLAGAAVLAPFVTTELALPGFLIVLQIAALPVHSVRDWPWLHVVRTVPAVLATLVAVAGAALNPGGDATPASSRYQVLAAAIVIAVAGLTGAVLSGRLRAGDVTASLSFGAAAVPMLAAPIMFGRTGSVLASATFATVLLGFAAVPWLPKLGAAARIPGHLAVVSALAGAFALLEACIGIARVQTLPVALLLVAMGFLGVAGQQRSRVAAGIGVAFGALGALTFFYRADIATLADQSEAEAHLGLSTALSALTVLSTLAVAGWCARRIGLMNRESEATALSVFAGIGGLYAVTALTVSLGIATGSRNGFLAGHAVATIVWMAAATAALLYGLRRLARTPQRAKVALGTGLLVTAAALAKLFLFDLATLDGLVRAAAFLVVGVLLLVVGTRYARAFGDMDSGVRSA
ncbi:DUF2339 domain-containing protein [Nocardia sp. NPDC059091]|uniref:DUF2339 domain-containing protein n=1 Tax=unclassified Nocardia TaxID=2637762 RepID=UPI0036904DEC